MQNYTDKNYLCFHNFFDLQAKINGMKYLDLNEAIKKSDSKLLKKMPAFIINLMKKMIHQDEINLFLNETAELKGIEFHNEIIKRLNLKIDITGLENLPENHRCFFFSNHPFGILDGLVITQIVLDKYKDFRAIGNEAFQYIPPLRPYVGVVNVYGSTSRKYIEEIEKLYESDIAMTYFPAGIVSRYIKGKVQDIEWKKSFITKAVSCHRELVPIYFYGRNSVLFYTIYVIRKLLGIKATIELALLAHEFFRKKNSSVKVVIGPVIPYTTIDNRYNHHQWAQIIRNYVYELGKSKKPDYPFNPSSIKNEHSE